MNTAQAATRTLLELAALWQSAADEYESLVRGAIVDADVFSAGVFTGAAESYRSMARSVELALDFGEVAA